jgi:hypothetical protein
MIRDYNNAETINKIKKQLELDLYDFTITKSSNSINDCLIFDANKESQFGFLHETISFSIKIYKNDRNAEIREITNLKYKVLFLDKEIFNSNENYTLSYDSYSLYDTLEVYRKKFRQMVHSTLDFLDLKVSIS